jgi:hypothetical protein
MTGSDKHTILLYYRLNYDRKKFKFRPLDKDLLGMSEVHFSCNYQSLQTWTEIDNLGVELKCPTRKEFVADNQILERWESLGLQVRLG